MPRFCKNCGVVAPDAGNCNMEVGKRHAFVESAGEYFTRFCTNCGVDAPNSGPCGEEQHAYNQIVSKRSLPIVVFFPTDKALLSLISSYLVGLEIERRLAAFLSVHQLDAPSHEYLSQEIPGITHSSDTFLKWFQNAVDSPVAQPGLQFSIDTGDRKTAGWDGFRSKYCTIGSESCVSVGRILTPYGLYHANGTSSASVMTVTGIEDCLLNLLCAALQTDRTRHRKTKPYCFCLPSYSLAHILIGEDNARENYVQGVLGMDPIVDLLDKTPFRDWERVYGNDVHFIFGFSCIADNAGAMFQLGLIDRATESFIPLHDMCNISAPDQRACAAEYVLLVRPGLVAQHLRIQRAMLQPGWTTTREHTFPFRTVTLRAVVRSRTRFLEKCWDFRDPAQAVMQRDRLDRVFRALDNALPFQMLDPGVQVDGTIPTSMRAFFAPFGAICGFRTLAEVRDCALDMVTTLEILGAHRVVHHDIRLDNIVCVDTRDGGKKYVLVDFDDAEVLDAATQRCVALSARHLAPQSHCIATYQEHGPEVDVWALGRLLQVEMSLHNSAVAALGAAIQREFETITLDDVRARVTACFDTQLATHTP